VAADRDFSWLVRAVARFGEFYWTPRGPSGRTRDEFCALADADWKEALIVVASGYCFERAGASPHYRTAASAAIRAYPRSRPDGDLESAVWRNFLEELRLAPDGRGANVKLNPLAPSEGHARSLTSLVAGLEADNYNLVHWAEGGLERGEAEQLYRQLLTVRGLGPKIVPFFLRDVAAAFAIDEDVIGAEEFLQPIDVWTRRGAQVLARQLDVSPPRTDFAAAGIIVEAARRASVLPSLLNAGIWCFGALFAQRERVFLDALMSPEAFEDFLTSSRDTLRARVDVLDEALTASGTFSS
jgi:hypothetical protein